MKKIGLLVLAIAVFACRGKESKSEEADSNPLSGAEEVQPPVLEEPQWAVLFDGTSFDGWHFYNGESIAEPWKLEDGAMVFYPPEERPEGASYNIVTDKTFTNFVLSLEWKVAANGNSGIFWGVHENEKFGQPYLTGPEIQVLDDEGHPDAKNGTTHQAGALYDMVAPSEKAVKPAGEWNLVEILVNHETNEGHVVLNGKKIIDFPVHGEAWDEMVANSKFADWEGFGAYRTGNIGLQDHGDVVAYRNIKIKEL
ncbi:3-keto-disaccharide hydrolase [Flagellimonas flava]|uniref:3-keto-alpha-glucoside-1,2-lyase/3-keto-2-hydroxy-glucal hydratase domain-containing protein n=1 Tax=Flagellimonas flava TaxID=570519 RepID=A0A1M5MGM2_9FLAO|nr:DUF1080 domain-containing protein [Allomuricauda flava]SHG76495.1 protein of unknown function [Allomuricauda flava]